MKNLPPIVPGTRVLLFVSGGVFGWVSFLSGTLRSLAAPACRADIPPPPQPLTRCQAWRRGAPAIGDVDISSAVEPANEAYDRGAPAEGSDGEHAGRTLRGA